MQRNTWIVLALFLALGLFVGCEDASETVAEKRAQRRIDGFKSQIEEWRKTTEITDYQASSMVRGIEHLDDFLSFRGIPHSDLGTTEEELQGFMKKAMMIFAKDEWENCQVHYVAGLLPPNRQNEEDQAVRELLEEMGNYEITAEDIGKPQRELQLYLYQHHARQAEYAMLELYRFSSDSRGWKHPFSPKTLANRVAWELEQARNFKSTEEIYSPKHGPVTVEHADELRDLAYRRLLEHILTNLRQRTWTYPESSDQVDLFLEMMRDAEMTSPSLGTSYEELQKLRLRVPELTTAKPHDG